MYSIVLSFLRRPLAALTFACASWLLVGCSFSGSLPVNTPTPMAVSNILLVADGQSLPFETLAGTVGEALAEAGITLNPMDEVQPPTDAELVGENYRPDPSEPLIVTVVRVTEALEVIPESVPYGRRIVRSAEMSPEDSPRLLQTGVSGLQEVSVRIVYRDGLEAERWPTAVTVIEPSRDEIIMIGVGSSREAIPIRGILAYIDDGRPIVLEGSSDSPRQLPIEENLDGRVFQLSPDGRSLLYTVRTDEGTRQDGFRNELWVMPIEGTGEARSLQIENVLWAGWDPGAVQTPRIAYSTARSISLPPGWEANNDLWLLELPQDESQAQPAPLRLIETYPATFGWWGGNYAWNPTGSHLAYAFADEIGLLEISDASGVDGGAALTAAADTARSILHTFSAFDTGADWAWVPALSWSADGRSLAFSDFAGNELAEGRFNLWTADIVAGSKVTLVEGAGIWSNFQWSPATQLDRGLAYLRANDPDTSSDSVYSLWISDQNGTNAQQVFPPEGESGFFARTSQSLAWSPDGNSIAFIFDETLHFIDLATGEVIILGDDDTSSSHLTWAPYGTATIP